MIDHHKFNQVVTLIVPAISDVISLIEQINTFPSNWHIVNDLASDFFSISMNKAHQEQLFLADNDRRTPLFSYLWVISTLQPYITTKFARILITFLSIKYCTGLLLLH